MRKTSIFIAIMLCLFITGLSYDGQSPVTEKSIVLAQTPHAPIAITSADNEIFLLLSNNS